MTASRPRPGHPPLLFSSNLPPCVLSVPGKPLPVTKEPIILRPSPLITTLRPPFASSFWQDKEPTLIGRCLSFTLHDIYHGVSEVGSLEAVSVAVNGQRAPRIALSTPRQPQLPLHFLDACVVGFHRPEDKG